MIKVTNPNTLLLRDSIRAGLAQYPIIRKKYFVSLNAINLGIGSDRVENVLWGAINLPLPSFVQNTVVQAVLIKFRLTLLAILLIVSMVYTVEKECVFGVILVRIFPHLD